MEKLSANAVALATGMFWLGEKSTVRSHPPHKFFETNKAAFDELLAAGLISSESYNDHGVVEYRGTAECHELWRQRGFTLGEG